MIIRKEIIITLLMMAFALNVVSQNILKTLTNGAFISKTGEIFEETPDDNP